MLAADVRLGLRNALDVTEVTRKLELVTHQQARVHVVAPVAREDDPERAVRAALAIRDWVVEEGKLLVRIGVNTSHLPKSRLVAVMKLIART